jgi:AcrR family transcriptional regulator
MAAWKRDQAMVKKPHSDAGAHGETAGEAHESADPRARIVDALMALAAERTFEDITIRDVCAAAHVNLADFRDAFPSKGAVLGAFAKRIDRTVLAHPADEMATESPRERLFDVLMRRFDAMAPYRAALREIAAWARRDPIAAVRLNQVLVNSMRFMLEAAGIDSEGSTGAVKLQGLAIAFARVTSVWLDDSEPELSKTMAALDKALTRGERMAAGVDQLDKFAAPFKAIARAAMERRPRPSEASRRRPREDEAAEDAI